MQILLFIFMCLAVWVCLKMSSENMVLVVLLHIKFSKHALGTMFIV